MVTIYNFQKRKEKDILVAIVIKRLLVLETCFITASNCGKDFVIRHGATVSLFIICVCGFLCVTAERVECYNMVLFLNYALMHFQHSSTNIYNEHHNYVPTVSSSVPLGPSLPSHGLLSFVKPYCKKPFNVTKYGKYQL